MADKTTDSNREQGTEAAACGSRNVSQGAASHVAADGKLKSYKGSRPYIFVSYSHKNETQVLEIIRGLQDHGYRVFYDEGIASGCDLDEYLATRIENCNCICAVFSDEYWASKKCQNELRMAINNCKKPNLGVHLQKHEIPVEFKLIRGSVHDVLLYEYNDYQKFLEKLCSSELFNECRCDPFEADVVEETKDAFIRADERGSIGQQGKCFEAEEHLSEDKTLSDVNYNKTNKLIEHLHQQIEMSIDMLLNEIDEPTLSEDPDRLKEIEAAYEEIVEMEASYNLNRKATQKYIVFLESQEEYSRGIQLARRYLEYKRQSGEMLDIREVEECLASMLCHITTDEENLEEAKELYHDILEIDRVLAKEDPVLYTPDLANCCYNLAELLGHYTDYDSLSEAEELYREAIGILRGLDVDNSAIFKANLASCCYNLAVLRIEDYDDNSLSEAEELYREAIAIQRELSAENPASYGEDLASSCCKLANLRSKDRDDNSLSEAEELYREAVQIQKRLITEDPGFHEEDLASSCYNLANLLSEDRDDNSLSEAEELYREAIDIQRRRLVIEDSVSNEMDLALNCLNLADLLSKHTDDNSVFEAEELYREAIDILRGLVKEDYYAQEFLASSCLFLAELLSFHKDSLGREESESLYRESVEMYRRLGMRVPDFLKVTPLEALSYDLADDKPESYMGSDPYIFISYARKDEAVVLNIIKELQTEGFRVSYDEGIVSGTERDAYVADRLKNCCGVCMFFSEEYWASDECLDEFRAFSKNYPRHKPFLVVNLQENKAPSDIPEMVLCTSLKSIDLYEYYNLQNFFGDLTDTYIFQECRYKSYTGEDPYIFVSYSHQDDELVLDIIRHLQDQGFRVSYDDGVASDMEWLDPIADRIENCYCFFAFFSEAYWASNTCLNELRFAIKNCKPHFGVHIQKVEVPATFQTLLNASQDINFYEYSDLHEFLNNMTDHPMLDKCREMPLELGETDSHIAMDEKPKSYTGEEPYIFISYSHENEKLVLDIIKHLQDQGFRVFYDEALSSGEEWNDSLAVHIEKCSCFCAMISEHYVASERCKDELEYAKANNKKYFGVYLQEVAKIPSGIRMSLIRTQNINRYDYKDQNNFLERLYSNELMSICRRDPSESDEDE